MSWSGERSGCYDHANLSRAVLKALARTLACLPVLFWAAISSAQGSNDPLERHLKAAQSLLIRGDQQNAALEYKLFLAGALRQTANAKARAGDMGSAEADYEQALKFAPGDLDLHLDYAEACFDAGEIATATSLAEWAVNSSPANVHGRLLFARVLVEQQKFADAKTQLQAAAALRDLGDSWYPLVITYLQLQDLTGAQHVLRQMLPVLGDSAATHLRFGLAYYYGDYPDEAAEELQKSVAADPVALDAHYYLGLAYLGHNEEAGFSRASPEFRAELKLNPSDFRSHFMLAYIALKQRSFGDAERELLESNRLNPDDMSTKLLLGQLYDETARPQLAEKQLRELIEWSEKNAVLDNRVVRSHYILGRTLQKSGRPAEGAEEIKRSEILRAQLGAATAGNRSQGLTSIGGSPTGNSKRTTPSAQEKLAADSFVKQVSPAIAEVYNNLGGIAANGRNFSEAVAYFTEAKQWDASLEGLDQNLSRAQNQLKAAENSHKQQ